MDERWSLPRRLLFRLFFAFAVLDIIPWPLGAIPGTGWAAKPFEAAWNALVPWFGKHVLHVDPGAPVTNGSGDTLFDWVALACLAALALVVTVVWSAIDRRAHHRVALRWLRVYLRYLLASSMLTYGLIKVLGGQFPRPDAYRWIEPVGQMSPMGLFWTMMG